MYRIGSGLAYRRHEVTSVQGDPVVILGPNQGPLVQSSYGCLGACKSHATECQKLRSISEQSPTYPNPSLMQAYGP
jgi:hypothetical protein